MKNSNEDFPIEDFERSNGDDVLSSLDHVVEATGRYRTAQQFLGLLDYLEQFPYLGPFNCLHLHLQDPNCTYVSSPQYWKKHFDRGVMNDARPLILLQNFGPFSYVYDHKDTFGKSFFHPPEHTASALFDTCTHDCARLPDLEKYLPELGIEVVHTTTRSGIRAASLAPSDGRTQLHARDTKLYEFPVRYVLTIDTTAPIQQRYTEVLGALALLFANHFGVYKRDRWETQRGNENDTKHELEQVVEWILHKRFIPDTFQPQQVQEYFDSSFHPLLTNLQKAFTVAGTIETLLKTGSVHKPKYLALDGPRQRYEA